MFSRNKDDKKKREGRPRNNANLAQFGLLEVPDVGNLNLEDIGDENDEDLEAELLALTGGGGEGGRQQKRGGPEVSASALDRMVADCMRDDDGDMDFNEEDPDLLAELSACMEEDAPMAPSRPAPMIPSRPAPMVPSRPVPSAPNHPDTVAPRQPSPNKTVPNATYAYDTPAPIMVRPAPMVAGHSLVNLLTERIANYEAAEAHAKLTGNTSRARRFNRGLKSLNQMLRSAKAGRPVNEEDIPPEVVVKLSDGSSGGSTPLSAASAAASPAATSPVTDSPPATLPTDEAPPPIPPRMTSNPTPSPEKSRLPSSISQNVAFGDSKPLQPISLPPSEPYEQNQRAVVQPQDHSAQTVIEQILNKYKNAALAAKHGGDKETALNYMHTVKQLAVMLEAVKAGQPVDLSSLPGLPEAMPISHAPLPQSDLVLPEPPQNYPGETQPQVTANHQGAAAEDSSANSASSDGPSSPATVLEALQQRMTKYVEQRDKAKNDGNARKERMNDRIIKQYQDAIKKHKAGRPIDFEELPCPPGFAAIPVGGGGVDPASTGGPSAAGDADGPPPAKVLRPDAPQPSGTVPQQSHSTTPQPGAAAAAQPRTAPQPPQTNVRNAPKSRVERQLSLLTSRQTAFKKAALDAKKRGEIEQAKEYLKISKGFDQLLEASRGGLPVDMNTVPVPPGEQLSAVKTTNLDFEVVDAEDCDMPAPNTSSDIALIYTKLEEDLISQIKMCATTREHFKAIGDVASSNRFEQFILHTKKDLDAVRVAFKRGDTPPRFHFENRSFNMIECNTDLNDSDCEVTILRGINFNVDNPKDVDTYVKIEFPYPTDNPPQDRSVVVKDTNNPEFNHKIAFSIDRKSRALARVFKRYPVKLQVIAKGGWFRSDTTVGSVKIPLVTLENKCTLHEAFDLTDERKKMVGGKLEVKIRVRNPIVTKQLEKVTKKWLVIDGF